MIDLYHRLILKNPALALFVILCLVVSVGYFAKNFRLDASSDSLLLENDPTLNDYRNTRDSYGSDEFLVVTYTPQDDLFSEVALVNLAAMKVEFAALGRVESVLTLLDVPLIDSPRVTLSELAEGINTIEAGASPELAKQELTNSPFYTNLLVNSSGTTTALQLNLTANTALANLQFRRDQLRALRKQGLSSEQQAELDQVTFDYNRAMEAAQASQADLIVEVRAITERYRAAAEIFLGGVPMIASDSIDYIRGDLYTFGVGVLSLIILLLAIAFRKPRWVILPVLTCFASGAVMLGILGLLDWPVTVVSSNFISLMLIITLSLCVHLIVHFREQHRVQPGGDQLTLVSHTLEQKFYPCMYTGLTTIVGFGSLTISGIRPVIDFGWMMCLGVVVAFVLSFTLFPAALMLLSPGKPSAAGFDISEKVTGWLAVITRNLVKPASFAFVLILGIALLGMSKVSVENRFIDYFNPETEIYQGMELLDSELGGTIPLDIVITAPPFEEVMVGPVGEYFDDLDADFYDDFEDDFDDEYDEEDAGITATSYWFNTFQLRQAETIQQYLESVPETGKVLSIDTTMKMLGFIAPNVANDDFLLSVVYKSLPPIIKESLVDPYMSEDGNELRFSIRMYESNQTRPRNEVLTEIRDTLVNDLELGADQVKLTGVAVLYNNMLLSLFRSQILTLGLVFVAIVLMFLVLFRNLTVSLVAIAPNILAAFVVLGVMGLVRIPLDLMTITIAAICIGIAVDNAIHYVYRYREEYWVSGDHNQALGVAHDTVGRAIFYTSVTVTLGFSILSLSNFVPTVYFGLLTGLAMLVALVANLTLLPILLGAFTPFEKPAISR
jgi:predicted RND superfamily exporter protein